MANIKQKIIDARFRYAKPYGMKQQTFDTSSTYHKNKDVAYYIAIWILGYDYQTETYNNR